MLDVPEVVNYDRLGTLIKQWCLEPESRPTTIDELERQLNAAQVGMTIPDRFTSIQIIQDRDDVLTFRIPSAQMINDTAELFKTPSGYRFPRFYREVFGNRKERLPEDETDKLRLQAERIGDYSIGLCM